MVAPAMVLPASAAPVDYDPFADGVLSRVVPTTEPQREVWLADRLGRDASLAFNESVSLRLRGGLDAAALRVALQDLLARHDALRASFGPDGETLCVRDHAELALPVHDLSALDAAALDAAVAAQLKNAVDTPFALERDLLLRAELLRLASDEHLLLLTAHHIVCDGWSWWVIVRELGALYASVRGIAGEPVPPPESFADYALAQALAPGGGVQAVDEAYWLASFADGAPVLELPSDRMRLPRRSFASSREDYTLDAELVAAIRRMGARRGSSLFATLLTGFAALISRLAAQPQVVVGIPAAGQSVDGHDHLVGHCVNLLPLRFDIDPAQSFAQALDAGQGTLLDALEHQRYTFGTLLRKLRIARDPSRLPLVSVMFNIDQALDHESSGFPGLSLDFSCNPRSHENFELFVNAVQAHGELRLECQYNRDLFDATTIHRWMSAYECLLRAASQRPETAVLGLPLVDGEARAELDRLQPPPVAVAADRLMHEWFELQCDRTPDRIAVRHRDATLSYAALEARANRIANLLRIHGVRRGALVGLALDRGCDMLAALLGILKAGAGYVPLDPQFPSDRLAYMAGDAGLAALVTQREHAGHFDLRGRPVLMLDELSAELAAASPARIGRDDGAATPESLGYVIYTSGSTGQPKGVQLPHRAVANFIAGMQLAPGIDADDRLLAVTTLSFDIAVLELLLPLSAGAQVVLADRDVASDGVALQNLLASSGATFMQATPATWRLLLDAGWAGDPRLKVLCGGEALSPDLASQLLPRCGSLWNMYGPTETTIWSTCARVETPPAGGAPDIHIGRPIVNTRLWILDAQGEPCPRGVPGEICIGGLGVALGYLRRPELTAERFIADRFAPAESIPARPGTSAPMLYRTGDRGRWRADGQLEHLGRLDFQVKVRGYRIELGEIEATLASHAGVARAVVVTREDRPGDVRLVAYIVTPVGSAFDAADVLAHLRRTLPDYMIPQHFVPMESLPLLPNGKLDRAALPAPNPTMPTRAAVAPRTALECHVAQTMSQVLGVAEIGDDDDFFALGGHSLLAAQLTSRLNRELGAALTLRALFDCPTVARLAGLLSDTVTADRGLAYVPVQRRADQRMAPLSLMQERLRLIEEFSPGQLGYNTPSAHRLVGVLDPVTLDRAFRELAQRQTVLRTSIAMQDGEPVQIVHDEIETGLLHVRDLSVLPRERREAELTERLHALVMTPFRDFERAPLFVARLFKLDADEHVLFFMPHHMIWDGWSFDLMYSDLSEIYTGLVEGRAPALPELPVTYGDFAAWHREWVQGPEYASQLAFWREHLGRREPGHDPPRAIPTDKPRRPGMSGRSKSREVVLGAELTQTLHTLGRDLDATVFVLLLTAYFALLARMTGQRDLIVGSPLRGRNLAEVEGLMGYFTNLLPLRLQIDPAQSFAAAVRGVKDLVLNSLDHPDVRLEDLTRELSLHSDGGGSMLYQSLFSFQDTRQRIVRWGNLAHSRVEVFQPGATEDLGLWFIESGRGLSGGLIYNADIFHDETAEAVCDRYQALLQALVRNPGQSLDSLTRFADGRPVLFGQVRSVETHDSTASGPVLAPPGEVAVASAESAMPATPVVSDGRERYLIEIWTELLGFAVEPGDNFFDLGGNSMLAVTMAGRVARDTGVRLKLVRLAAHSLAQIATDLPLPVAQSQVRPSSAVPFRPVGNASTVPPPDTDTAGRWEPLWIGSPPRQRYAALHRAPAAGQSRFGVLLAPPLLHESPRSRRLMTEVAGRLAIHGLPCLRFDYYGTGDSAGTGDETSFATMRDDLDAAAATLRQLARVDRIVVLTLRGGALPVSSWLEHGADVERLVLWEPIVDGAAWLAGLEREHADELKAADRYPLRHGIPVPTHEDELMGLEVSPTLRRELAAADLRACGWLQPGNTWALLRPAVGASSMRLGKVFALPVDMPSFGGSTRMDSALFISPGVQPVVDAMARALASGAAA